MTRYPSDVPGTDTSTVELFDNGAPKGVFTTANGHWSTTPIDVAPGFHSFTAQGRYGSEPISPARTFRVAAVVTPTLTDIRDSRRSIVGGTTVDTAVIVEGTGSLGQLIQLMDGAEAIGNPFRVPTDQTKWSTTLAGLNVKAYNLKARALYGNGVPDSTAKGFIVAPALDFGRLIPWLRRITSLRAIEFRPSRYLRATPAIRASRRVEYRPTDIRRQVPRSSWWTSIRAMCVPLAMGVRRYRSAT